MENINFIWQFLLDSNFLYPEKLNSIDVDSVKKNVETLNNNPNSGLLKTFFLKEGDIIKGHISAVRSFTNVWNPQHLASKLAIGGKKLSLLVMIALSEVPNLKFAKIWYRPNNLWPNTVYGSYAKSCSTDVSNLVTYTYAACPSQIYNVKYRVAVPSDYSWILARLAETYPAMILESDDLNEKELLLNTTHLAYNKLGLYRYREIIVIDNGFALLETSSCGLNFSELTNSFKIFPSDKENEIALIKAASTYYNSIGHDRAIALISPDNKKTYNELGFTTVKDYVCWTLAVEKFPEFIEYLKTFRLRDLLGAAK